MPLKYIILFKYIKQYKYKIVLHSSITTDLSLYEGGMEGEDVLLETEEAGPGEGGWSGERCRDRKIVIYCIPLGAILIFVGFLVPQSCYRRYTPDTLLS
ncbi:hypothetical protein J2T58_001554 [Methanocalculus alkaliphilus]|uniref:hypothetical protein n=1 Tax=Methanocalculus alkaliphilus TaxID=768730 RepID=UPI00209D2825|nr:hypothetical protein [Methanocalculus alkaliphilus]MCP1715687.1 hypothetical protein [Methanocalculus alkaliphilus]